VDILLPDATQMAGGITARKKIAALAEAFHMPVAAHIGDVTHIHCVAAVPNGLTVEIFTPLDKGRVMHELDPITTPNSEGLLEVPQKPGLGIELNEDYIAKHLVA
jgi:galactonate dehydratase